VHALKTEKKMLYEASLQRTGLGFASSRKTSASLEAPAPGAWRWQGDHFFVALVVSLAPIASDTYENTTTGAHRLLNNHSQTYQISLQVLRFVIVNQN